MRTPGPSAASLLHRIGGGDDLAKIAGLRAAGTADVDVTTLGQLFGRNLARAMRHALDNTALPANEVTQWIDDATIDAAVVERCTEMREARLEAVRVRDLYRAEFARATAERLARLRTHTEPYDFTALSDARPELTAPLAAHTTCGLLPATFTAAEAEPLVTGGPDALSTLIKQRAALITVATVATTLGIPQVGVRALLSEPPKAFGATMSHAALDLWTRQATTDRAAFLAHVDAARALDETARAVRNEELTRERAAAAAARELALAARARLGLTYVPQHHPEHLRTCDVAAVLALSSAQVLAAIKDGRISAVQVEVRTRYGGNDLWFANVHEIEALRTDPPAWLVAGQQRRAPAQARADAAVAVRDAELAAQAAERARSAAQKAETARLATEAASAAVRVRVPLRRQEPTTMVAHLGPTNSGKTHDAIELLARSGRGVYAAPLRALAAEVHATLSDRLGEQNVGLVTGDEQINPDAPIVCCTVECAPMTAHTLVLDEVHWIADPDRGWAWARLLAGAEVEHLQVIGASESEPLLRTALGKNLVVVQHERLTGLAYTGTVTLSQVTAGTLVVAFSRKAVLYLAHAVADATGLRVGALYGAMPPAARRDTIAKFAAGDFDVLAVTDVIGHGINLPAATVVLAEMTKFDGTVRRVLHRWEAAQILGRAGRFGLAGAGTTAALHLPNLVLDATFVQAATATAAGSAGSDLKLTTGELRPTLGDLRCPATPALPVYVRTWHSLAQAQLKSHPWLRVCPVTGQLARLGLIGPVRLTVLSVADAWGLVNLPVDDPDRLNLFIGAVAYGHRIAMPSLARAGKANLVDAEELARFARDVMAFTRAFGDRCGVTSAGARALEDAAARRIISLLPGEVRTNRFGRCACGKTCPPWFSECDSCHTSYGRDIW